MQNVILFNSILKYAPDIVTTRAPLNGDQLCGHVYIAWPNYSNHCCKEQIKVSWDKGYLSGRTCSQGSIASAQSSCINFKTISVSNVNCLGITNLCFPWPNYTYCYSLMESKCLNGPNKSSWSIVITIDADYQNKLVLNCSFGDAVSTVRWPNYMTNYSQRRSMQRCLCAWTCSDRIIVHVCKMSCLHSILQ